MLRLVSTEVEGWRDALTDRAVLLTLLGRLLLAALCAAGAIVGVRYTEPRAVVLGTVLVVLVGSLVRLRVLHRP